MFSEEGRRKGKREAERQGQPGFAEFCQGLMPAKMEECCGAQMREMMARCMARFQDAQQDPGKTEEPEA